MHVRDKILHVAAVIARVMAKSGKKFAYPKVVSSFSDKKFYGFWDFQWCRGGLGLRSFELTKIILEFT